MRPTVRALIVLLFSPSLVTGQERPTAPIDVGRLRPPQAKYLEERASALADPDPESRRAAILDLARAGDAATTVVVDAFEETRNPLAQRAALLALYEIGTPTATAALERAWEGDDLHEEERAVLALVLGARARTALLPSLREAAASRRASPLRRAATLALGRMGDSEGLKGPLERLRADSSAARRAAVVIAAGVTGDRVLLPAVLLLLADDDVAVRRASAFAVGEFAEAVELEALLRQARREPDESVRGAMMLAWGRIDHPSLREPLEAATRDRDPAVRESAWAALAARGDGAPLVATALSQGRDPELRAALARACAGAPTEAALVAALLGRLDDRRAEVRAAAGRALAAMGSRDDPQALLAWLASERDPEARRDAVLVAGVLDLPGALDLLAERPPDDDLGRRVERALRGRLDPRALHEALEERLREEGGRLDDKSDAVLDELVGFVLDLDDVSRRVGAPGGGGGGAPGPGGGFGAKPPRIDRRDSSYQRDLIQWFDDEPYFPRAAGRRAAR